MRRSSLIGVATSVAVSLLVASCADTPQPGADATEPIPIILDGDFGPDDMMALLYVVQHPAADLLAVTVSGTGLAHCPQGAANAAAVLVHVGRDDIPVGCGADMPLDGHNAFPEEWRTATDRLVGQLGVSPVDVPDRDAVDLILETIDASTEPVHLLVLGPLTNIASALLEDPALADRIADIVIMGGALDVPGTVDPGFEAEWNLWADPHAANVVLESGIEITLVPLDATNDVPATRFLYETLEQQRQTEAAELVYYFFTSTPFNLDGGAYFFWDPLAAVALLDPEVVTIELRTVSVDEAPGGQQGRLMEVDDGTSVRIAIGADAERFESLFLGGLNGGVLIAVEIPEPDFTVHYDGQTCTFDGDSTVQASGAMGRFVVELINDTRAEFAVVTGLHEGVDFGQVVADAAEMQQSGQSDPPSYWQQSGLLSIHSNPLTGGRSLAPLDLSVGSHALACGPDDGRIFLLVDLVVEP